MISKMEYTKGEWEVYTGHDDQFRDEPYILAKPERETLSDTLIARMPFTDGRQDTLANAHLIAAAHDMYGALKYLTNRCTEVMEGYNHGLIPDKVDWAGIVGEADRRARKALSKAEGGK